MFAHITWCVGEANLGVIYGEVGSGKTVAVRAAVAALDPSRHTIIYLGNPAVGARGTYATIITTLGGVPRFHKARSFPKPPTPSPPNQRTRPSRRGQSSRGLPRAVNNLAIQALVAAYATNHAIVDESYTRAAITEVASE